MELTNYDNPTYIQYPRSCDQWAEWKRQAVTLPLSEIRRHASVSIDNNHSCVECFCCACANVLDSLIEK